MQIQFKNMKQYFKNMLKHRNVSENVQTQRKHMHNRKTNATKIRALENTSKML